MSLFDSFSALNTAHISSFLSTIVKESIIGTYWQVSRTVLGTCFFINYILYTSTQRYFLRLGIFCTIVLVKAFICCSSVLKPSKDLFISKVFNKSLTLKYITLSIPLDCKNYSILLNDTNYLFILIKNISYSALLTPFIVV